MYHEYKQLFSSNKKKDQERLKELKEKMEENFEKHYTFEKLVLLRQMATKYIQFEQT